MGLSGRRTPRERQYPRKNGTRLSHLVEDFERRVFAAEVFEVLMPRLLQPPAAFGSSFDPSRFIAPRSFYHASLGDPPPHLADFVLPQDRTRAQLGESLPAGMYHLLGAPETEKLSEKSSPRGF